MLSFFLENYYVFYFSPFLLSIEVATAIHILLNKADESSSAGFWLVVVFAIPGLGVLLYLFFGINRIQSLGMRIRIASELGSPDRYSPIHRDFQRIIEQGKRFIDTNLEHEPARYGTLFDRLVPESRPIIGNRLTLLRDGTEAYPEMLAAIRGAGSTVNLQSFIISSDEVGRAIFDALLDRARNGVQVNVLYDQFGSSFALLSHFFSKYTQMNMPNFRIHPFVIGNVFVPWRVQLRNHRKLLIVDGKTAFVGGINLSRENDSRFAGRSRMIHDLHCRIDGPSVADFQYAFLRDWFYVTRQPLLELFTERYLPVLEYSGDSVIRVVTSGPGQNPGASETSFHVAVISAVRQIWIMTPYFVPDRPFLKALRFAVARGVDVRVIVPEHNNHWFVRMASRSLYSEMLNSGIRIFETTGPFVHAKAMLIDGEWVYMGSSNCDVRSFRLNFELDFAVSGGGFVEDIHEWFVDSMRSAKEIQWFDVHRKRLPHVLAENLCSLLIPIL